MPNFSADKIKRALVIVAAGSGSRAGETKPKQYVDVAGRLILLRTVGAFSDTGFDQTVIVHAKDDDYIQSLDLGECLYVVGGATRSDSVRAGLEALRDIAPDRVFIHDAARPFVTWEVVSRLDAALATHQASVPTLPLVDAIKSVEGENVGTDMPREAMRRVQTPQAFRYADILSAFESVSGSYSDDIAVAVAAGLSVAGVAGDERNFKITYPEDFAKAEAMLSKTRLAVGTGYDVHQTCPGDHVWLCGVKVPAEFGLLGHSDADIGLHALVDAILGALAEGDIGDHFPPSDPKWKDAESWKFLDFCRERVEARGGTIEHVDVTLICEAPKVKPHRDAMRTKVAEILDLPLERVGLKATTTEQLGFTGRSEGLAAQAVASVKLPL